MGRHTVLMGRKVTGPGAREARLLRAVRQVTLSRPENNYRYYEISFRPRGSFVRVVRNPLGAHNSTPERRVQSWANPTSFELRPERREYLDSNLFHLIQVRTATSGLVLRVEFGKPTDVCDCIVERLTHGCCERLVFRVQSGTGPPDSRHDGHATWRTNGNRPSVSIVFGGGAIKSSGSSTWIRDSNARARAVGSLPTKRITALKMISSILRLTSCFQTVQQTGYPSSAPQSISVRTRSRASRFAHVQNSAWAFGWQNLRYCSRASLGTTRASGARRDGGCWSKTVRSPALMQWSLSAATCRGSRPRNNAAVRRPRQTVVSPKRS
jgi:hypothetical protein